VRTLTKSVWSYVFGRRNLFANPRYVAFEKPIWPSCGAAAIQVCIASCLLQLILECSVGNVPRRLRPTRTDFSISDLLPVVLFPQLQVWSRFWLRWDPSAHPNNLSENPWHDDW